MLLTERADIDAARSLLAGVDGPDIPNGRIVRETGVNEGWSWSLDPADFEFADVTIEVCDGTPSRRRERGADERPLLPLVGAGRGGRGRSLS